MNQANEMDAFIEHWKNSEENPDYIRYKQLKKEWEEQTECAQQIHNDCNKLEKLVYTYTTAVKNLTEYPDCINKFMSSKITELTALKEIQKIQEETLTQARNEFNSLTEELKSKGWERSGNAFANEFLPPFNYTKPVELPEEIEETQPAKKKRSLFNIW